MSILDLFRRSPRIGDAAALADFIDRNTAFLVQKGVYEYSRARAGPYSKMLMVEASFLEQVDRSRWQAYPLGLLMMAEMVQGVLRSGHDDPAPVLDSVRSLTLSVFDRYPTPKALDERAWQDLRQELLEQLGRIGLHPPKMVKDIPEPYAERYFALMPIHERLRGEDFPTVRNYLRVTLCNIHEEFVRRMESGALHASLRSAFPPQSS